MIYEPVLGLLLALALWWGLTGCRWQRAAPAAPAGPGWAGNASYAMYLLHQIFVPYVSSALATRPLVSAALFGGIFAGTLVLTLPLAVALFRWVETPWAGTSKL